MMNRKLDYEVYPAEHRPGWMLLMGLHKAARVTPLTPELDKLQIENRVFISLEDWEGFDGQFSLILQDNLARKVVVQIDNSTMYDIIYWMRRVATGRITFGPYTPPSFSKWHCFGGEILTVGAQWNTVDNAVTLLFRVHKDGKEIASVTVHTTTTPYAPGNLMLSDGTYVAQSDNDAFQVWCYYMMQKLGRAL